jgi:hypothetical protein
MDIVQSPLKSLVRMIQWLASICAICFSRLLMASRLNDFQACNSVAISEQAGNMGAGML